MNKTLPVRRALVSVADKTGLEEIGQALRDYGVEILSTGGTARALEAAGVTPVDVAAYTGAGEMMDGRVKTLHPRIHAGLLARADHAGDDAELAEKEIGRIDLVIANLYPFELTVQRQAPEAAYLENIDIGGPAMIRAAAKNYPAVGVVVSPADYPELLETLKTGSGTLPGAFRRRMAGRAFAHCAAYDVVISRWFNNGNDLPDVALIAAEKRQDMRYGENPHQRGAWYAPRRKEAVRPGLASATQIQGKPLSYNNVNDTDAAFELVAEFSEPAVAIIKHANPCGAAVAETPAEAYRRALLCDPVSAFGSIVALNRPLDAETAGEIAKLFTEVIIAPEITKEAREILSKKKNLRLLESGGVADPEADTPVFKALSEGFLMQDRDSHRLDADSLKTVTERAPTEAEIRDMLFGFKVVKHVKSNAVVYVKDGATVGIGAGQMSRVDASRIAVRKAREAAEAADMAPDTLLRGSVVASDAFFPFADGLLAAAEAGATAVVQPGGSKRDQEVIEAANSREVAMAFTGIRHFRH